MIYDTADVIVAHETTEFPDPTHYPDPKCPGGQGECLHPDGTLLHERMLVGHTVSDDPVMPVVRVFGQWEGGPLRAFLQWATTTVVQRDGRGRVVEMVGLANMLGNGPKPSRAWLRYDETAAR